MFLIPDQFSRTQMEIWKRVFIPAALNARAQAWGSNIAAYELCGTIVSLKSSGYPATVTAISEGTGINKDTTKRKLLQLVDDGVLEQRDNGRTFRLTAAGEEIGVQVTNRMMRHQYASLNIIQAAEPVDLTQRFTDSVLEEYADQKTQKT